MAEQDEDEERRIEEEKKQAQQIHGDMKAKVKQKMEFHQKNTNPKFFDEDELRKFDGSIKKNTAFARKLRELNEAKRDALRRDFESLNLSKYIEEVAKSIAEAKLKLADVGCAVFICSLVHCRYGDFSIHLTDDLQRTYVSINPEEDKSVASTRYRLGLRLIGELVLAGIVSQDLGVSFLSDILTRAITSDQKSKSYSFVSVVTSFARQFADDFAGMLPRKHKAVYTKYNLKPPQTAIVTGDKKTMFAKLLTDYYESVKKQLLNEHKDMHKRSRRNRLILQNKGELSTERQEENEKAEKTYEKLLSNVTTLSEILDMDMPDLPEDRTPQDVVSGVSIDIQLPVGASDEGFGVSSLWEDEEQRSFYEDITDIKPFIPAILYEGGKRKKTDSSSSDPSHENEASKGKNDIDTEPENPTNQEDEQKLLEEMIKEAENLTIEDIEEDGGQPLEEPVELAPPTTDVHGGSTPEPNQFDEFLASLPNMMNRKVVDQYATEFCLNNNTKHNRQRLCRALFNVDRNRMDLVPFYARFTCTIAPLLSDIPDTLVDMLKRDFRFQVRKKDQIHVHSKIKNARLMAELTKFNIFPRIETMKCITLTLQDFTHHNVDLACSLMEHCGRFLLRSPESYLRAKALLEIMVRKKTVQHLDGRQKSLIDDALYSANPPEIKTFERIKRPPLLEYILLQLYRDLNKLNTEKVLKQLRKLPWNDSEVFEWAVQAMTEVWNVKFSNIHCMANLLAGLRPYQEEATIWIVDGVLEDIRLGLEINENRMNQRRVSMIKYLGELYNYQLVESNVIFRTLYTILTFGCNPDGSPGPLDQYDNYFRSRLVCVLLDTCGLYFDHGTTKKKLDAFLVFFQCYLFNKRRPLPLEVDHMITDTLIGVQPNLALYTTPQEAVEAASNLEKKFRSKIGTSGEDGYGGEDSEEEDDAPLNSGNHGDEGEEEEEDIEEEEDDDDLEDDEDDEDSESDEEDMTVLKSGPKLIKCQEDDEFLNALDRMMTDSRKVDPNVKSVAVDVAVPLHLKGASKLPNTSNHSNSVPSDLGQMKFTLMTKRGRKQELKEIEIPIDSKLASGLSDTQQLLRAEQEEMKQLVLTHERRQEEEEHQAMMESMRARFQQSSGIKTSQQQQQQGGAGGRGGGRRPQGNAHQGGGARQAQSPHSQGSRRPHSQQQRRPNDRRQQ